MSLVRWLPRRNGLQPAALDTELGRLFEDFFSPAPLRPEWSALTPAVDVEETPDAYVFRADLPGMSSKDVKVTVHNDTLTLRGERKREEKTSEGSLHRAERAYGSFERSFTLGLPVRADQVKASYKDGVLEVHVPKADEAKPRDIEVQIN
ncbi:MAG TPA: Hsp20/alpha crystallin family protein [Verrucomicrobiae bacterium]|jgi:HSP20 family protein|nr:Hsp20/alpha crystallin family protein [Verrucomicrobiae bacterium]